MQLNRNLLVVIVFAVLAHSLSAETILRVPSQYFTVQDAWAAIPGDGTSDDFLIHVAPGMHYGQNILIGKRAIIETDPEMQGIAIFDGENAGRPYSVLRGEAPTEVTLRFITIQNGFANNGAGDGGALRITGNLTLAHVNIRNCAAKSGGAISAAEGATCSVAYCNFDNCTATDWGGAIWTSALGGPIKFGGCRFFGNTAGLGGGALLNNRAGTIVDGCNVSENSVLNEEGNGGGLNGEQEFKLSSSIVCANTPDQVFGNWSDEGDNMIATACPSECPTDINGDGITDGADLTLLLGDWGPCKNCAADITGDDMVDGADLTLLLGDWGPCSTP